MITGGRQEAEPSLPAPVGGFNAFDPPDRVQDDQMVDGSYNYIVNKRGSVKKRPGFRAYAAAMLWSDVVEESYRP